MEPNIVESCGVEGVISLARLIIHFCLIAGCVENRAIVDCGEYAAHLSDIHVDLVVVERWGHLGFPGLSQDDLLLICNELVIAGLAVAELVPARRNHRVVPSERI